MTRLLLAALLLGSAASAQTADTQTPDTTRARFQTFDATGAVVATEALLDRAAEADVVFLGEIHDDPTGHAVELAVLQGLAARAGDRPVVLAMEMFEADVQLILDEYVRYQLITERDFLEASRPWQNYADYRPLIEFARGNRIRVVGSNAPARYVRHLARSGSDSLWMEISPSGLVALHPVASQQPQIPPPSTSTAVAFSQAMNGMAGHGGPSLLNMLAAQNLRDATMAWWIVQATRRLRNPLVVHINGGFHTAGGRGIPEHLARLAPDAQTFNIQIEPATDVDARPDVEAGVDAVVQTPARLVPSRSGR